MFAYEEVDFQSEFADYLDIGNRIVYRGSLTTPPFTEFLLWNVIPQTVPITTTTLELFAKARDFDYDFEVVQLKVGASNREVQDRNDRAIYKATYHPSYFFDVEADFAASLSQEDRTKRTTILDRLAAISQAK